MRTRRFRGLLAAGAVGLAGWLSASDARAQVSYGYDSLTYGALPAQSYYYSSGYSSIYTDPTTGVYANGANAADPRTLAPYAPPPYGSFNQGNGIPNAYYGRPAATAVAPAASTKTVQRRGIFGRMRTFRR